MKRSKIIIFCCEKFIAENKVSHVVDAALSPLIPFATDLMGKIEMKVNEQPKVKSHFPYPSFSLNLGFDYSPPERTSSLIPQGINLFANVYIHHASLAISNMKMGEANTVLLQEVRLMNHGNVEATFSLDSQVLKAVESQRTNDIIMSLRVGYMFEEQDQSNRFQTFSFGHGVAYVNVKLTAYEWNTLISEMEIDSKWIVEVAKPSLEGFHEVLNFLDKASKGISQKKDPEEIISYLRAAWDSLDPYILKYEKELKDLINGDSKKEDKQPEKDERIDAIKKGIIQRIQDDIELRKMVDKLTQIGPHRETYVSSFQDALLAYRLTMSMISYYSHLITEVSGKNENGQ